MCVVGDTRPQLVPELDVTDLGTSLRFYLEVCRFTVRYERVEERFVYLECGRADLMLQEAAGPGRRFRTAPLQPPLGRGINLQIEVDEDVARLEQRAVAAGHTVVLELEEAGTAPPPVSQATDKSCSPTPTATCCASSQIAACAHPDLRTRCAQLLDRSSQPHTL